MTDQEKIELLKIDTKKFNDDYYHDCYSSRGGFYLPEEVLQELSTSDSKSEEESDFYMEAQVILNNRPWTYDAFKDYIPTKSLSGDDLASRLFRKNLQKVSREHKWAERAKKLKAKEEQLKKQSEAEQQIPPMTM